MFFFITPKIVSDPNDELIKLRNEELKKRPGDLPEFLKLVNEAKEKEKRKAFLTTFKTVWGN